MPRNRRCGNCRFFEAAPLWRKGWCRNPELYQPHANHLVDSTTIDCEGGFRSRIYWEPLPPGVAEADGGEPYEPLIFVPNTQVEEVEAIPAAPQGANFNPVAYNQSPEELPVTKLPPPPKDTSGWRAEARKRLPFTENWPLEKYDLAQLVLWGVAAILALIIIFNLLFVRNEPNNQASQNAAATVAAQNTVLGGAFGVTAPAGSSRGAGTNGTPAAPVTTAPPTAQTILGKQATVINIGKDVLQIRKDAAKNSPVIDRAKEGDKLKIVGGPIVADDVEWYQVEINGKTGWASKQYLQLPNPGP